MITVTCKSYRARADGEGIVLEIDDCQSKNFVPQLMTNQDVAERLRISVRKVGEIAKSEGITPIRIGTDRYKEDDILRLLAKLTANQEPRARITALPLHTKKCENPTPIITQKSVTNRDKKAA